MTEFEHTTKVDLENENLLHKADVVRSEVFNEDCMIAMKRYPDKYFNLIKEI